LGQNECKHAFSVDQIHKPENHNQWSIKNDYCASDALY
jgi:hypothetical protein